jgi:serine protease Do
VANRTLVRSATAIAVAAALSTGYVAGTHHSYPSIVPSVQAAMMPAEAAAKTGIPDFSGLAQTYGPAVVNISAKHVAKTTHNASRRQQTPQMDPDDPFYQFFRHFYGQQGQGPDEDDAPGESLGSGFVTSPDGYILTNAHVIAGADVITVKLTDKREFRARVIGVDKPSDVAVLKIDAKDLPTVKIGDPQQSKVGQWVVAIGSPYGFDNTVTSGIISAKARSLPDETYVPFIQTDVPVNPGNSGGPLFNMTGEVIGINAMIYSQTGGFQGLSFAIPIDVAMHIRDELVKSGHVSRGRLGVSVQEMNQTLARSFGLDKPAGALVNSVEAGGPAARAGVRPGDVILKVDGVPVEASSDLPGRIAAMKPGTRVALTVWRDHAAHDIALGLGELTDSKLASNADTGVSQGRLGVAVRPLTPQEKSESELSQGLVVEQASGAAASAGIEPGDVILAVNGQAVSTAAQLRASIGQGQGSVALLIQRDNAQIFVPVDLG